jgi:small subunit ribosomal protein S11
MGVVKKKKSCGSTGIAHIRATFNNTIITITTESGDTIDASSGGRLQKGARKSTASVAEDIAKDLARTCVALGLVEVRVYLRGMGSGREQAIRGLSSGGLKVTIIVEKTGIPHNGCRPKKRRRA